MLEEINKACYKTYRNNVCKDIFNNLMYCEQGDQNLNVKLLNDKNYKVYLPKHNYSENLVVLLTFHLGYVIEEVVDTHALVWLSFNNEWSLITIPFQAIIAIVDNVTDEHLVFNVPDTPEPLAADAFHVEDDDETLEELNKAFEPYDFSEEDFIYELEKPFKDFKDYSAYGNNIVDIRPTLFKKHVQNHLKD